MATKYQDRWDKTKKEYESLVGKKPNSKILSLFRIRHTGITKSLVNGHLATEAASNAAINREMQKATKLMAAARAARKTYLGVKDSYLKDLEKALKDEKSPNDVKTVQHNGIKFLQKEMTAIGSEWDDELSILSGLIDTNMKHENNAKMLVDGWQKGLRGCLDRALAEAAKIKAKPTVEVYNAKLYDAARNLVTELTRALNFPGIGVLVKKLEPRLQAYAKDNNKYPACLPTTAKPAQVAMEIDKFQKLLKDIDGMAKVAKTLGK